MQAEDLRVREELGAAGSLAKARNGIGGNRGLWPEVGAALPLSRPPDPVNGRTAGSATTGNTLERSSRLLCYESGNNV